MSPSPELNYRFFSPSNPNPAFSDSLIALANSPGTSLGAVDNEASCENPGVMSEVAMAVAQATGALVCAYERPGSTDGHVSRRLKRAFKPGLPYDQTVGQVARGLAAAIKEEAPGTNRVFLAGHTLGANFSLALAKHANTPQFPVAGVIMVDPLLGRRRRIERRWQIETRFPGGFSIPKGLGSPLTHRLADTRYYLSTTDHTETDMLSFAAQQQKKRLFVGLPLHGYGLNRGLQAEALAQDINQARKPGRGVSRCSAELIRFCWFMYPERLAEIIAYGLQNKRTRNPPFYPFATESG